MQATEFDRQYNAIDLAKFVCAILVVMIHVAPFGNATSHSLFAYFNFGIQNYFARIAVPFFFVSSGFLLFRKASYERFNYDRSKNYIIRMLRLYVIWTIIYFPFVFRSFFYDEKGFIYAVLSYVRNLFFTGSFTHLWYFPALIFAVILISFSLYIGVKPYGILSVAFAFYILGLLAQSWYGLILPIHESMPSIWNLLKATQLIIVTTRDGLFEAFFFVSMGMYFAFFEVKMSIKNALLLFVFSMILMGAEVFFLQYIGFIREYDMYFFLVPVTFFFFCLIITVKLPDRPIYKTLRMLSSLIFYSHLWINLVVSKALQVLFEKIYGSYFHFLITIIITIVFSYVILKMSGRQRLKWLKTLYT